MNNKFFLKIKQFSSLVIAGLMITACSQDNEISDKGIASPCQDESGIYHYKMRLNCEAPNYKEGVATRSITYNGWDNGALLFVRFKTNSNGSSYIDGTATYDKSQNYWTIATYGTLPVISGESDCEFYYFVGAEGVTSTAVNMTEGTSCFYTTTATYTHSSETEISATALLKPLTWRMRFKGTPGETVILPTKTDDGEIESNIAFYNNFNRVSGKFSSVQEDKTLTVGSNGYTPYVYGYFTRTTNNTIILKTQSDTYHRIASKYLVASSNGSGFYVIPTASNLNGWIKIEGAIANCDVKPKYFVAFTDGMVTSFTADSNVSKWYYNVLTEDQISTLSDNEIIAELTDTDDPYTADEADNYIFSSTNSETLKKYSPNTTYYLCTYGYDANGRHGYLTKYQFNTLANNLPIAEISNIKATSTTKWTYDINMKNNATSYYLSTSADEDDYKDDVHFDGWRMHRDIKENNSTNYGPYNWASVQTTLNSGTTSKITILTWAVNSSGNIGGFSSARGSTTSSARTKIPFAQGSAKEAMDKAPIEAKRKSHISILQRSDKE